MTAAPPPAGRPADLPALTALRGLLAVWVVSYHLSELFLALFPPLRPVAPAFAAGHLAVPGFFVLSGYVLAYNYLPRFDRVTGREYARFLAFRLARVYPVHLFTLGLTAAAVAAARATGRPVFLSGGDGYSVPDLVRNLLLVQTWVPHFRLSWNYPSWSISSECLAYLLFPLVAARLGPLRGRGLAVALAAAWAGTLGLYLAWPRPPFWELVIVLPTFLAGCVLGRRRVSGSAGRWGLAADAAAAVVVAAPLALPADWATAVVLTAFVPLVAGLGAAADGCSRLWRSRPAVYLGEVSYSLYMTHALAYWMCLWVAPFHQHASAGLPVRLAVAAGYLAAVSAAAVATYHLVEMPTRRWGRRAVGRWFGPG